MIKLELTPEELDLLLRPHIPSYNIVVKILAQANSGEANEKVPADPRPVSPDHGGV